MKAVIQRVLNSQVSVEGEIVGSCGKGFMVLFGAAEGDSEADAVLLAEKTSKLRIFEDDEGKMNKSLLDINGEALVISQFTLCADTRKGNRPSFIGAMEPNKANMLYQLYCEKLKELGVKSVGKGIFGADMKVSLVNDGPVTIILDTDIWRKK